MKHITIPARPFAFELPAGRTALIVIDMQRDFIEPGGTVIRSLRISPRVTASRCSAIASIGQPVTSLRPGSSTGQKVRAK